MSHRRILTGAQTSYSAFANTDRAVYASGGGGTDRKYSEYSAVRSPRVYGSPLRSVVSGGGAESARARRASVDDESGPTNVTNAGLALAVGADQKIASGGGGGGGGSQSSRDGSRTGRAGGGGGDKSENDRLLSANRDRDRHKKRLDALTLFPNLDPVIKRKTLFICLNAALGIILYIVCEAVRISSHLTEPNLLAYRQLVLTLTLTRTVVCLYRGQLCWDGTVCETTLPIEHLKLVISVSTVILLWQLLDRTRFELSILFNEKRRKMTEVDVSALGVLGLNFSNVRYTLWLQLLCCAWHPFPYFDTMIDNGGIINKVCQEHRNYASCACVVLIAVLCCDMICVLVGSVHVFAIAFGVSIIT